MDKKTAIEKIKNAAEKHGFVFVQRGNDVQIKDGDNWLKSWVNFTVLDMEDVHWNMKEHTITERFKVTASVSRMGGHTNVRELLAAADSIKRAAELVAELEQTDLEYTINFDEE